MVAIATSAFRASRYGRSMPELACFTGLSRIG